jgi:hypothetical protein
MSMIAPKLVSDNYPLGEKIELSANGPAMALVALSHTLVERRVYAAMLNAAELTAGPSTNSSETLPGSPIEKRPEVFTVRRVMELAGINSVSTIRRGLEGLVAKLSVEREARTNSGNGGRDHGVAYRVFTPEEVIARRDERGIKSLGSGNESNARHHSFARVLQRILENRNLSRREAQVALCRVERLTKRGNWIAIAGNRPDCEIPSAEYLRQVWREAPCGIDIALADVTLC